MTTDDQFLADLQNKADRMHNTSADADRPPANAWAGILAQATTQQIDQKEVQVTTLAMPHTELRSPANQELYRPIPRFLNIAVSVVIIAALAFGGWFAAMQLNDPGTPTPDPRFAVIATPGASATPQTNDATCDVEPLSVDRVIEIVENPAYFMANGPTAPPSDRPGQGSPPEAELWEVDVPLQLQGETSVPSQELFDDGVIVANEYLHCLLFGTQGQVWSFYSPADIQTSILAEFPVFSSESEVRARIEERLSEPAYTGEAAWQEQPFIDDIGEVTVNPDRELAVLQNSGSSYFDQVMMVGVSIESEDGEQIALTIGTGRDLIPNDPFGGSNDVILYVTIVNLRYSDGWLIIPYPSPAEIGY